MTKPVLPFLETMLTQACNLSCKGCTNYSDLRHSGYVTWADGKRDLESWLDRIDIPDFGLMGGEPLMNPQVRDWLSGCRELMPNSQLRFTTNGELLNKHLDILDLVHDIGNTVFKISVHRFDKELEDIIEYVFNKYKWEVVHEYGITRYLNRKNNVRFQVNRPQTFIKTYRHDYDDMLPYDSKPEESFDICIQQTCPLLYKGRIYKCSTSGLLLDTLVKTGNADSMVWNQYKQYRGIGLEDSLEDINKFISTFGKPESICAMCPSSRETEAIIVHQNKVRSKNNKL